MPSIELLKIEWFKFRKNTVITLLLCFFLLFFPCCLYFGRFIDGIPDFVPFKVDIFTYPHIWDYLGYAGNWMVFFFLGVLIIYTVTIEVANKTLRQAIINGMSRNTFLLAKCLNIVGISLLATAVYTILCIIFGWINTEDASMSMMMDNQFAIGRFFLMCLGYLSFALFLAFLFRKSGIAVFFYLAYVIIMEPLLRVLTRQYLFSNKYLNYYPLNAMEDLMPSPIFRVAEKLPSDIDYEFLLTYKEATLLSIIYSVIFLSATWYLFQKRDI